MSTTERVYCPFCITYWDMELTPTRIKTLEEVKHLSPTTVARFGAVPVSCQPCFEKQAQARTKGGAS